MTERAGRGQPRPAAVYTFPTAATARRRPQHPGEVAMRFVLISDDETEATPLDTPPADFDENDEDEHRLLLDEGEAGVWVGFSSADRCSFGGELPIEDHEDFVGNGDPVFFLTAGVPSGTPVKATPSVENDATHPLYAAWLATHD